MTGTDKGNIAPKEKTERNIPADNDDTDDAPIKLDVAATFGLSVTDG